MFAKPMSKHQKNVQTNRLKKDHSYIAMCDVFSESELNIRWESLHRPLKVMSNIENSSQLLNWQGLLRVTYNQSLTTMPWQVFYFEAGTKVRFNLKNFLQILGLTNYSNKYC
ncbi:MAG: hypothetical protein HUJ51_00765 [Eggerthellaceae bacterium]|nr:hypothetical protein [Eggerthellaceae bacterium]